MEGRLRDIPARLRTPVGRANLTTGIQFEFWPLFWRLAALHRRTLVRKTRVVAVVGSYGKSTTVRAVLTALGLPIHPQFELNTWTSLARAVLRIRPGDRHAVLEVGVAHPGHMVQLTPMVRPDIVVVTSVGSEHHSSFKNLEATRAEKSQMVRVLPPSGLAVLNGDDPNVLWMKGQSRAPTTTFGFGPNNDVRASEVHLNWPHGTRFVLHAHGAQRQLSTRLLGQHQVYPVLAAVAVAMAEGRPLDAVCQHLEELSPTLGRLQTLPLPSGGFVIRDDCKSSLETIDVALDLLAEIPAQRRIVVLGEVSEPPGSQGPIYRRMGERIAGMASAAIFVGSNFQRYATGAIRGGLDRSALYDAGKRPLKAATILREIVRPGDVVLVKGRNNQRLGRVAFALLGQSVACDLSYCATTIPCEACSMLERGWQGLKPLM